ncbi:unnamed protein product [Bursaphelenchus xylophilus]|uniref:(pine wood nematode) hypothetical protein n=1 Tax=Bursaphelenchus xylophilus TaxID=6326 RepID=A0A1I7SHW3_BURXY|nr:unnamed protein product [Bursaphelenchus xylophilus]CAG9087834.1 unnamed protein product [Bursaphelenchus xylophilus]
MLLLLAVTTLLWGYALCIQCGRSRHSSKNSSVSMRSQETSARKPKKEIKPTITSACCEAGGTTANQDRISVKPLRQMDQESDLSRSLISPSTVH